MGIQERKARHREDVKQDILDAARTLFVREGYDHVSIRKIADKVECAPGTIYLYFQDKDEILRCLCQETFSRLGSRMEAIRNDSGDPLDQLRREAMLYINFGLENPSDYIVTFILRSPHQTGPKAMVGLNCFDNLRQTVRKCLEAGRIYDCDPEATAQALWAGVHGVVSLLLMCNGFPFVEQTRLAERLVEIQIEGIRKR